MDIENFRKYCLNKKGTTESFPFDADTLVFKVLNKVYALTSLNNAEFSVNLKCDPEKALELRENHEEIKPGYHMNKIHWNTVSLQGNLEDKFILQLIDHSYDMVYKGMSKKEKAALELL